ncbi:MAG: zinc ribbon domain-containing protein [Candidatus Lokiarchaeota archaeon]|nr:zinc ribbon domain-containing protein [Candidatus Lokiarchaeota archaeon]
MEHSQKLINLANKRFGDVLRDGFKLFSRTYKTLILPLALFQVLLIVLNIFLLTDLSIYVNSLGAELPDITEDPADLIKAFRYLLMTTGLLLLQNLIGATVITIAMCSVGTYVFKKYMDEDVSFSDSFKSAFKSKIFYAILILGICLPISFLAYIPALFVFAFFIFLVFTYNMDVNKNPISEARAIAKGAFWKIIGVFAISALLIYTISLIFNLILDISIIAYSPEFTTNYNSWYNSTPRNYGMIILYNILYNLIDIILAPLFICLLTTLFSSLKAKKDLGVQFQRGYQPSRDMYQESYRVLRQEPYEVIETEETTSFPEISREGRVYCPFCGTLIQTPKRFCPKCGENLENILGT